MSDKTKITLAVIFGAAGLTLLLGGHRKSHVQPNYTGAIAMAAPSNQVFDTSNAHAAVAVTQNAAAASGHDTIPGEKDMANIVQIAKTTNLDEAYTSYQIFADGIMNEGAANLGRIQALLKATLDLSDFDPSNDHYAYLVPLWNKYPDRIEEALQEMSIEPSVREHVLTTVKSFAKVMKEAKPS